MNQELGKNNQKIILLDDFLFFLFPLEEKRGEGSSRALLGGRGKG